MTVLCNLCELSPTDLRDGPAQRVRCGACRGKGWYGSKDNKLMCQGCGGLGGSVQWHRANNHKKLRPKRRWRWQLT